MLTPVKESDFIGLVNSHTEWVDLRDGDSIRYYTEHGRLVARRVFTDRGIEHYVESN